MQVQSALDAGMDEVMVRAYFPDSNIILICLHTVLKNRSKYASSASTPLVKHPGLNSHYLLITISLQPYNIDELLRTMQQKVANRPAVLPTPQRASPLPAPTPASESFLLPTSAPVPVPGAISLPQTPLALSALVGPTPTLRTDTGDGEAHADEVETNGDGDVEPTLDVETPTPPLRGREPQLQ